MSSKGSRTSKYSAGTWTELVTAAGHRSWPKTRGNGSGKGNCMGFVALISWQVKLTKSVAATHSASILYHLVFRLGLLDNMEHDTGNKGGEDPGCLSKPVTYHALRAGHEIVRKEEGGVQSICLGLSLSENVTKPRRRIWWLRRKCWLPWPFVFLM